MSIVDNIIVNLLTCVCVCVAGCQWQGRPCQLVVNHEEGFVLYATGVKGSPGSPPAPLWRRSFDKLKLSADDGNRLLWLDFGGEDTEIVSCALFQITFIFCVFFFFNNNSFIFLFYFFLSGTRLGELPKANSICSAQLFVGKDTSIGADCIGVRGGFARGPRFATAQDAISDECFPSLSITSSSSSNGQQQQQQQSDTNSVNVLSLIKILINVTRYRILVLGFFFITKFLLNKEKK